MEKTSNQTKLVNQKPSTSSSKRIFKPLQKETKNIYTQKIQTYKTSSQQKTHSLLKRDPNFKYYFFNKQSSEKSLHNLQNSKSAQNLYQRQLRKSITLQNQINLKQKKILSNQYEDQSKNQPFYTKYQSQPIENDPQLADYCMSFPRKRIQLQRSPKKLQKLRENKLNIYKYRNTKGMISPDKVNTQQNIKCQSSQKINSQYNQTLSPYQFKNTIQGTLMAKSSRNIRMDIDKSNKIQNINKIWYDESQNHQIFKQIRKSTEQQNKLRKAHSFDNYKGHALFQSKLNRKPLPAEQKHYIINAKQKDMNVYKKWKTQNHLNMDKMLSHPAIPQKLGTNLDYNIDKNPYKKPQTSRKIMGISSSQRKLTFTRQVISPSRGCYR